MAFEQNAAYSRDRRTASLVDIEVRTRSTCRSIGNKQQNDRLTDDAAEKQQDYYSQRPHGVFFAWDHARTQHIYVHSLERQLFLSSHHNRCLEIELCMVAFSFSLSLFLSVFPALLSIKFHYTIAVNDISI